MVRNVSPVESKNETDKRKSQRIKVNHNLARHYVEIPLSVPKGAKIKKEIVDISNEGLSFLMSEEEGAFLVDTPLVNITVVNGHKRSYFPQAKVVYNKKLYGEGINYRIGLQFIKDGHSSGLEKINSIGQTGFPQFRLPRYDIKQLGNISKLITFKNKAGTYSTYEMVNFSKYGLAFKMGENDIEESETLRIGEVLEDLKVIIGHEKLHAGRATIAALREQDNALVVGVRLEESWLEVDKIFYLGNSEDRKKHLKKFLRDLPIGDKISGEFKQIIADMRYYLESIESKLKEEEARLTNVDSRQKRKVERDILQAMIRPFSNSMNRWIIALNTIIKDFTKQRHEIHKRYFRKQLHHLLLQSPFIRRSVEKPFAYSGDYLTINMILNNAYDGDTLLGKLIGKHAYNTIAARVVRLRKDFIERLSLKKIRQSSNNNNEKKILSIGCGAAGEIEEIIKTNNDINCEFYLLDFDTRPLYFAEERLSKQKKGGEVKTTFLNKSIRALLKEKDNNKYDLIYSLGLTDYLSDNTCKMLLKSSFGRLKPGGTFVIGQYGSGTSTRCYMEYGLDWHLIYRDYKDLSKWLVTIKAPSKVEHYSILGNAYHFITITK